MRTFLVMLSFLGLAVPAHAVPITACGDSVPAGATGDLMNDLTCDSTGVFLVDGATLDLNGFRITGPTPDNPDGRNSGVFCGTFNLVPTSLYCAVNGPGEITSYGTAINGGFTRRMTVQNVTLDGNGTGIYAGFTDLTLTNVVADQNSQYGVVGNRVSGTDVDTSNNGDAGMVASRAVITRLTSNGNGTGGGLEQIDRPRAAKLTDSTLTGNDGLGRGYDILWVSHVRLRNTVCGKSGRTNFGAVVGTYHVCVND